MPHPRVSVAPAAGAAVLKERPAPDPAPTVATGPTPAVAARGLSLTYETSDGPVQALSKVDLVVSPGAFVSFIGPSGCGKTTLLRCVADLEQPTGGELKVNGIGAAAARQRRDYGFVFQAPALYPWRTVEQNVALPLEIFGVRKAERHARVAHYMDLVQLSDFARKYPWQLSGGMQSRASIARALCFDPKLLLMDEPFGALDEIVRDHLNAQLLALWRATAKTVLFVTHSIPEAVYLSERVVVMSPRPGRIIDIVDCARLGAERPLEIRESADFLALAHRVREGLRAGHAYDA